MGAGTVFVTAFGLETVDCIGGGSFQPGPLEVGGFPGNPTLPELAPLFSVSELTVLAEGGRSEDCLENSGVKIFTGGCDGMSVSG